MSYVAGVTQRRRLPFTCYLQPHFDPTTPTNDALGLSERVPLRPFSRLRVLCIRLILRVQRLSAPSGTEARTHRLWKDRAYAGASASCQTARHLACLSRIGVLREPFIVRPLLLNGAALPGCVVTTYDDRPSGPSTSMGRCDPAHLFWGDGDPDFPSEGMCPIGADATI